MSLDESTLDDFTQQDPDPEPEPRPEFDPDGNECRNCGRRVTADYARVFGDNENRVHACPECMEAKTDAGDGAAAGLDPRERGGDSLRGGRR